MSLSSRYIDAATVEQLNHLTLAARRVVEGSSVGLHRSQLKGASVEFRQHRAYVPGDEPRRLDWRVLARTKRSFVKEYDEETNIRCLMLLDCSGSMRYATEEANEKYLFAKRLVAALSYLMLAATESVGLALYCDQLQRWVWPQMGSSQLGRLIEVLDSTAAAGEAAMVPVMNHVARQLGRRALVIVLSDFFSPIDSIREALARLRHERHEVICLRILHPDEVCFPFQNWSLLHGLERGTKVLCEPAFARRTYLKNFERHSRQLSTVCRSFSADLHVMMSDQNIADTVRQFLTHKN